MSFDKKTVHDIDLKNKRVLVRTMLNVPIKEGKVSDTARLEAALPTLRYLLDQNASLILISHHSHEDQSLAPVAPTLADLLKHPVSFVNDCIGDEAQAAVNDLKSGEVIMLENLRFHPEEEANDAEFAKTLASYADVFVQDDFTTCHREHASMVGIPQYVTSVAGLGIEKEVDTITKALEAPKRPVVAVTGGAKISTKIPILSFLLEKVDAVFVGGAMANTFLLAQGMPVGKSLIEDDQVDAAKQILETAQQQGKQILLPIDVVVTTSLENPTDIRALDTEQVGDEDIIADLGSKTVAQLDTVIQSEGTVIWNGPVGIFETPAFAAGTQAVADKIIASGAYSLVGGGDTLDFVDHAGLHDKFSFVSTGGGASLELMSGKTLPGVDVLESK